MRDTPNPRVEKYRVTSGPMPSDASYGNNGWFSIPSPATRAVLNVIVSDGMGWEHVSVSLNVRCPTWTEMSYVKDLFWGEEEVVIEYHPRRSVYVKTHPYCLHLWKPIGIELPEPLPMMVGTVGTPELPL